MANEAAIRTQQAEQIRIAEDQKRLREAEEKRRLTKELLERSGALPGMREIENGLRGSVRKHVIIEDLNYGQARLVWGNKFKVDKDGFVDYEKSWGIGRGEKDYSYIIAEVNLKDQSLSINGKVVEKDSWQKNGIMQESLAKSYLNPKRINEREEPPSRGSSDSSSGSTPEGCCQ